ncbi:MAG: DUF2203 domain-containing protein [Pyrinomonadaceae bacterium]|jgi:hypothetical protein|nr:DUF2203 domain-containing protein [Pyrinomonadaceae bacterium]
MKLFTIEEANLLLQTVQPKLIELQNLYKKIVEFKPFSKTVSAISTLNSGTIGGSIYVKQIIRLSEITNELNNLGVQIKDFSIGLIDFPCLRENRIILLCWKIGEGNEIEWWHEIEDGFKGRQRL